MWAWGNKRKLETLIFFLRGGRGHLTQRSFFSCQWERSWAGHIMSNIQSSFCLFCREFTKQLRASCSCKSFYCFFVLFLLLVLLATSSLLTWGKESIKGIEAQDKRFRPFNKIVRFSSFPNLSHKEAAIIKSLLWIPPETLYAFSIRCRYG